MTEVAWIRWEWWVFLGVLVFILLDPLNRIGKK
jgi:hypothetical protein